MSERTLPHDLEAERSVLGACLVDQSAIDVASDLLDVPDFYRDGHQRVFRGMLRLSNSGQHIDFVTLKNVLVESGELDQAGDVGYLASLADGVPRGVNVPHYAGIVREKSMLRRLIDVCALTLRTAYGQQQTSRELVEQTEQALIGISGRGKSAGFVSARALSGHLYPLIEQLQSGPRGVTGIPTGLHDLDDLTRGLQRKELIYIAGRPSMGKTSLALQIALHVSQAVGPVGFSSLEMSKEALGLRAVSILGPVDGHRMLSGWLRKDEQGSVMHGLEKLGALHLWIDEDASTSVMTLRSRARRLQSQLGDTPLALLVVDYIQMMHPTVDLSRDRRRAENRTEELSRISGGLKGIAKEFNVPVVALSQLSRAPESRAEKRPVLSDLRESGSLEQDADLVLFPHRPHYYDKTAPPNQCEVIIAKARNGPTGAVELIWRPELSAFANAMASA